jgi:hypothetical protein
MSNKTTVGEDNRKAQVKLKREREEKQEQEKKLHPGER